LTVYHFEELVVRVETSGDVRASVGTVINVTDPATGLTPAGLTQGGVSVSNVVSGTGGLLEFEAGVAVVHLNSPSTGFDRTIVALEQYGTGGSGVTDHGALTGLADDDHPQYLLDADAVPLSSSTPSTPGTAFAGTENAASHGDHVHPAAGGLVGVGSGSWVCPYGKTVSAAAADVEAEMRLWPLPWFPLNGAATIAGIGAMIHSAASAGGVYRFGLYGSTAAGLPDLTQRIMDGGTVAATSTGWVSVTFTATAAKYGMLWIAQVSQGAATTQPVLRKGTRDYTEYVPGASGDMVNHNIGFKLTGVTGALPATGSPVIYAATINPSASPLLAVLRG
jgi:hypothetical protein